jgi:predicted RNase H-like nuclease (RuvC/YqgF family)
VIDLQIENVLETKRRNTCIIIENVKLSKCNVLKNRNIRFQCINRSYNVTIIANDKISEIIETNNFPQNHTVLEENLHNYCPLLLISNTLLIF